MMLKKALKWVLIGIAIAILIVLFVIISMVLAILIYIAWIAYFIFHLLDDSKDEAKSVFEFADYVVGTSTEETLDKGHRQRYWWLYRTVEDEYDYPCLYYLNRSVWPPFWGHKFKLGEGL